MVNIYILLQGGALGGALTKGLIYGYREAEGLVQITAVTRLLLDHSRIEMYTLSSICNTINLSGTRQCRLPPSLLK